MADEIQTQAQAASEPSPTAVEEIIPATETTETIKPEQAANAVPVEEMDAEAYAQLEKELIEHGLPAEEKSPEPKPEVKPADPVQTEGKKPDDDDEGGTPARIRLTAFDKVQAEAIVLARDMKIGLAEAETRVKAKYGITEQQQEPAKAETGDETPEAIEAKIAELKAKRKQAATDVDTVAMDTIQDELDAEKEKLATARAAATNAAQNAAAALKSQNDALRADYPEFKDKNSPLSKEWEVVRAELEGEDHPILSDPIRATKYITMLAAERVDLLPVSKRQQAQAKAPAPISATVTKQAPPVRPASGSARTATPSNATGQIEQMIDGASNLADIERIEKLMLAGA